MLGIIGMKTKHPHDVISECVLPTVVQLSSILQNSVVVFDNTCINELHVLIVWFYTTSPRINGRSS